MFLILLCHFIIFIWLKYGRSALPQCFIQHNPVFDRLQDPCFYFPVHRKSNNNLNTLCKNEIDLQVFYSLLITITLIFQQLRVRHLSEKGTSFYSKIFLFFIHFSFWHIQGTTRAINQYLRTDDNSVNFLTWYKLV